MFSLDLSDSNNIEVLFDFEIEVSEVKVVFCCLCLKKLGGMVDLLFFKNGKFIFLLLCMVFWIGKNFFFVLFIMNIYLCCIEYFIYMEIEL